MIATHTEYGSASFFRPHYEAFFADIGRDFRPELDLIVAGYGKSGALPRVATIRVKKDIIENHEDKPGFDPIFGGQSREIERIVYGVDTGSFLRLEYRHEIAARAFAQRVLEEAGVSIDGDLPGLNTAERLFASGQFDLPRMAANWGDFSEQNAIDCVTYFVRIMCDVQRFNSRMPTVGGQIHIALIDREDGFRFISREEYTHENHRVQRT